MSKDEPEFDYEGEPHPSLRDAILAAIRDSIDEGGGRVFVHQDLCTTWGGDPECCCEPLIIEVPEGSAIA